MGYTRNQKLTEIGRELAMRRRVYPRLIAQGKMSEAEARSLIAVMEAIYEDYLEENRAQKAFEFEGR